MNTAQSQIDQNESAVLIELDADPELLETIERKVHQITLSFAIRDVACG